MIPHTPIFSASSLLRVSEGSEVGPGGQRWAPETRRPGDPEKIALCGIIGHRPLRGRCPIDRYSKHKFMIDGAMGTAGHITLVRLF